MVAQAWFWGMAIHLPVTQLWPFAGAAELGQRSLRWDNPLRLSMSAGGLTVHSVD